MLKSSIHLLYENDEKKQKKKQLGKKKIF